ncbi:MAG: hypothetical protein LBB98_15270 [Treponema sp.]|jgi:hypothetical protein|nr:hypothetical protein [Treponema sp.]
MANVQARLTQYLSKYEDQSIACNQYTLMKLGVDKIHCHLKIDKYVILCVPFQLGFKRSFFIASLSRQELIFFQRYINGIVGLSIGFSPDKKQPPIQFFIRCNLVTIGQMKGRENVGLFAVDYKTTPDDLVILLGNFLDNQARLRVQYDDYRNSVIRMTPNVANLLGYNMYATITEPNTREKRIQVFNLSIKTIEHLEAAASTDRPPGTSVAYQLFFKKYRVSVAGTINNAGRLPQGIIRTSANLAFCPELVEIIEDYWYTIQTNTASKAAR